MRKSGIIVAVFLMISSLAVPAYPLSYEIDVGQNGTFETGGDANLCGRTNVSVDIYIDGYACPPDDLLFGVQTYITVDESLIEVNDCQPNTSQGCDPSLSGCSQPTTDVYLLVCTNLNFIPVVSGLQKIGELYIESISPGYTGLVVADDIGGGYTDGFLSDCNLASLHPDDGIVEIFNFAAPCACEVSPDPATVNSEDTLQFIAHDNGCCDDPPHYVWSDNCTYGDVDQNGLFTADTIPLGETCQVFAVDIANTYGGGEPGCNAYVEILPALLPCQADSNGDGKVDLADLVIMKEEFLRTNCGDPPCLADCNGDNKVDLADLVIMKGEFLRTNCLPSP